MKKYDIKYLYNNYNCLNQKAVTVGGCVRSSRDLKDFGFLDINDGTCFKGVQVVFEKALCENYDDLANEVSKKSIVGRSVVVYFELYATSVVEKIKNALSQKGDKN